MKYQVVFLPYTKRHYCKAFAKKYKHAWDETRNALNTEFRAIDALFAKSIAEIIAISQDNTVKICKTEFKIVGSTISRHASGYRCIIAIHTDTATVRVLLVYSKTDITSTTETAWWKNTIKENYPEYVEML